MTGVEAGILLPESTLTQPWFLLLATIVAFNTIIYVGLTLSKLIPWPHQLHPSRVRSLLRRINPGWENSMSKIPVPQVRESDDPYQNLRLSIAKREIPQGFALMGLLIIGLAIVTFLSFPNESARQPLFEIGLGLSALLVSQVFGRRPFRGWTVIWVWALSALALLVLLLAEAVRLNSIVAVAFALIVLTSFAPVTLAWRPTIVVGLLMLATVVGVGFVTNRAEDVRISIITITALLVSCVLLQLRLVAIDEIADERARSSALASTDPLTGVLSRQGLISLLPAMAATAERTEQSICVMFFDIVDLGRANSEYGVAYGDDVIKAVATAVTGTVRRGDLVSRWGGDEFLVAGLGSRPAAEHLAERIQEAVRLSGVNLGKWPTQVTVQTSAGDPRTITFDELVAEALAAERILPA